MSSWLEKIKTDYRIYAGDTTTTVSDTTDATTGNTIRTTSAGRQGFSVFWLNAMKDKEYNTFEFVFKNVEGSLVQRGNPRGNRYNIEIYFQGEGHLDTAKEFETASDWVDANGIAPPWEITHPFYGSIFVQPISLRFDNSDLNVTKITGLVIETITKNGNDPYPIEVLDIDPVSKVSADALAAQEKANAGYEAAVPNPKISDAQAALNNIKAAFASVQSALNGYQADINSYLGYYRAANAALNTVIFDAQQIADSVTNLIMAPAYFNDTVARRLAMFQAQLAIFDMDVVKIQAMVNKATATLKKLYENNGAAAIIGMCLTTVTNILNDYDYKISVLDIIDSIIGSYNSFVTNLCALQSANGGLIDSYMPDPATLLSLTALVNFTTSNLLTIASGAKQQRILTLVYDDTIFNIANQLYGMQEDDSTLTTLIANNNLGIDEYLVLKAGRQIIYYV